MKRWLISVKDVHPHPWNLNFHMQYGINLNHKPVKFLIKIDNRWCHHPDQRDQEPFTADIISFSHLMSRQTPTESFTLMTCRSKLEKWRTTIFHETNFGNKWRLMRKEWNFAAAVKYISYQTSIYNLNVFLFHLIQPNFLLLAKYWSFSQVLGKEDESCFLQMLYEFVKFYSDNVFIFMLMWCSHDLIYILLIWLELVFLSYFFANDFLCLMGSYKH